jgi:hypothetical protein
VKPVFTRYYYIVDGVGYTDFSEEVPTQHPWFEDTILRLTGGRLASQIDPGGDTWGLYEGRTDELVFDAPVTEAEAIAWVAEGVLPNE